MTGPKNANETQRIRKEKGEYFFFMLNMADDDLDVYQFRLLGHYRRVCGAHNVPCIETTRETAEKTRMAASKVCTTRRELEKMGWIKIETDEGVIVITIVDRMLENTLRYSGGRSPQEQTVRQENVLFATRTDRSPQEHTPYIESTIESTSLNQPTTTGSPEPDSPPPPVGDVVVAADVEVIKPEVQKLHLTPKRQAELLAKGAAYALAITWAVQGPGIKNPGGLAMALLKGDGPPEQLIQVAAVAIELGITDQQKAEEQLNWRALAELEESLRESEDESTEQPESPAESKNDIVSHLPAASEPSVQNADQAGNGLDYKPGDGALSMRDIWQVVDGSLSLQLNQSTYEHWIKGTRAVSFVEGVLTLRAKSGVALPELKRVSRSIKFHVERMARQSVEIACIADTPGAIPRRTSVPGSTGLAHTNTEGQEQRGLLGPQ